MEIDSYYSGQIKTGDFIVVAASGSFLDFGFFLGRGQGDSVQYYRMINLARYYRKTGDRGKIYKAFYNAHYPTKIAKYSPDCLSLANLPMYEDAIEALKLLKIIKQ